MLSEKLDLGKLKRSEREHTTTYGSRYFSESIPKYERPEDGMPAKAAYQLIHEELNLDGNPALNLASFVTTWMEPEADQLIMDTMGKNYVDNDEYPQTQKIEERVVNHPTSANQWEPEPSDPQRPSCWDFWPINGPGGSEGKKRANPRINPT